MKNFPTKSKTGKVPIEDCSKPRNNIQWNRPSPVPLSQMDFQLNYEWSLDCDCHRHFRFDTSIQFPDRRWAMAAACQRFSEHPLQRPRRNQHHQCIETKGRLDILHRRGSRPGSSADCRKQSNVRRHAVSKHRLRVRLNQTWFRKVEIRPQAERSSARSRVL